MFPLLPISSCTQDQPIQGFLEACNQPITGGVRIDARRQSAAASSRPTASDLDKISGVPQSTSPDSIITNAIDRLVQHASAEPMMKFLPLLLNKLFGVLVRPSKGPAARELLCMYCCMCSWKVSGFKLLKGLLVSCFLLSPSTSSFTGMLIAIAAGVHFFVPSCRGSPREVV